MPFLATLHKECENQWHWGVYMFLDCCGKNCTSKGREEILISRSVQSSFFYFVLKFYKWFVYTRYK